MNKQVEIIDNRIERAKLIIKRLRAERRLVVLKSQHKQIIPSTKRYK